MNERYALEILTEALAELRAGFAALPDDATAAPPPGRLREVLRETARRLHDNYPYHHPLYAGQMLKPPHPVARLAYMLALHLNPNNHALDGGRASSRMEKEAVAAIARMFGWDTHLGHLTSGGTVANLEALWVAGRLREGETVLASAMAHYTHGRMCEVLRLPFEAVVVDARGRMDLDALEKRLQRGGVGTVVATLGTTAIGALDPLSDILALRARYGFRLHVDAAYGGYFTLCRTLDPLARREFDALAQVDSIVVDPHKHGLQPYGCGCVLFRDPTVGRFYRHDSPYTYFSSDELHLGEISLECSRAGAAAVALWATLELLPLERGGEFAQALEASLAAAREFHAWLAAEGRFLCGPAPSLDIVVWSLRASGARAASRLNETVFRRAAEHDLHLAVARLPRAVLAPHWPDFAWEAPDVACLRSCLMKPAHRDWLPEIERRLLAACEEVAQGSEHC
ncbi:MAG TPA: aminotransferase class I/II-fold pyridoxal phosphate-dependent enzyme [Gammaproteobacteria bacterium]|nr:aminotransferase class I/II-fold pyridoxal phosphate-dependent enzyme [Gammaproteobacteria bacterium]